MSLDIDSDVMIYTEELEDTPPDVFDGLTFTITGAERECIIIKPFVGNIMVMSRDDVENLQAALANYIKASRFDCDWCD